jgi:ankyrin repeat protein
MNRWIDQELFEAAAENNLAEAHRLLGAGADVNATDFLSRTPLIVASTNGHSQVVNFLLEHGALFEAKDVLGKTALHWACFEDHLAVVNHLLNPSNGTTTILGKRKNRGANIETKDNEGDTPLHFASFKGHLAIVQALLSCGAKILAFNSQRELPIHQAMRAGHSEVTKCLLQHFYATVRRLPLHKLVKDLTWIGNPNRSDVPPLRAALHRNLLRTDDVVEILEYLVGQNPALCTSRDQDGSLPLHVACRRGASFFIVQSLVNHYKASVKSVTFEGDLPLFLACEMPETSLGTIFILTKQYPDVIYR